MTVSPSRTHDPGVVSPGLGGIVGPLIGTRPPAWVGLVVTWLPALDARLVTTTDERKTQWMTSGYGVFLGLDVGKGEHHAVALNTVGKRLHDAALPNDEPKLRALFDKLIRHGPLLVVVDQPATIGALPVAVARACGHQVAYLPGRPCVASRTSIPAPPRPAPVTPSSSPMPLAPCRTLRTVDTGDDMLAELSVLVGFDDDLAAEATRISNRIRGLLISAHPALERALGPRITHPAVLEILSRSGPTGIRKAGQRTLTAIATAHAPRIGENLAASI
jgi:hypothetical protein